MSGVPLSTRRSRSQCHVERLQQADCDGRRFGYGWSDRADSGHRRQPLMLTGVDPLQTFGAVTGYDPNAPFWALRGRRDQVAAS